MYDAVLATRGWGARDFDLVTRTFREAVHHALFAERAVTEMDDYQSVLGLDEDGMSPSDKARAAKAKLDARRGLNDIVSLIQPEDDDG